MPTIKTKKEMNLAELIVWITENDITYRQYIPKLAENTRFIAVNGYGEMRIYEFVRPDDVFTVEIEEEITEDTVFDNLIEINELIDFKKEGLLGGVRLYKNSSINQVENDKSVAYYIMNDDLEMTLIWKRKEGMVE